MLQQHRHDVLLAQAHRLQRTHQEDVRIGAARHRDALALEILDLVDRRILARYQSCPFRTRIDVDRFDRIAVDLAEESGGARRRAEIDRTGIQEFQRLVGAERLYPAHADAVFGEFLFQKRLLLKHHGDRIIGRPVDADFRRLIGGAGEPRQAERDQTCADGATKKSTARQHENLPTIGFFFRRRLRRRQLERNYYIKSIYRIISLYAAIPLLLRFVRTIYRNRAAQAMTANRASAIS